MSKALVRTAELTPELRLAQAISEFKADLSQEEKQRFQQELSQTPSPDDVMRLTAEVDRSMLRQGDRRCFGPRLTSFLQGVQQFALIGDIVIGGSQFLPACGVWALVRLSLLSIVQHRSYVENMSRLFMEIGKAAPSYQRMALLFPRSKQLQQNVQEYLIRVVQLCHRMLQHSKKSKLKLFLGSMNDSTGAERKDLEMWSLAIRDEMQIASHLAQQEETQENTRFRFLQRQEHELERQIQKENARLRILDALSTYDYQSTWKQLRKLGNTTVLAGNDKYSTWKTQRKCNTLYLTGQLGAGKSVVLANMIDDLFLSYPDNSASIAYFFCRHDIKESLTMRTIIGAIARQLLKDEDLSAIPLSLLRQQLSAEDITNILKTALAIKKVIYVVLDGFHECDVQAQEDCLSFLRGLQSSFDLSICISARMRQPVAVDSPVAPFCLAMPQQNPDIPAYVEQELERLLASGVLTIQDPRLILEIQKQIEMKSEDMFLWVSLQMQLLCCETSDHGIRQMLKEMPLPKDLATTYMRLLNRTTVVRDDVRTRFVNFIMAAFRPLTVQELKESLGVVPGDINWDASKITNSLEPILSSCSGLIIWDEEQDTVRLVHSSALQFLQSQSDYLLESAHEAMVFTIVTYLSYPVFETSLSRNVIPIIDGTLVPAGIISSILPSNIGVQHMAINLLRSRSKKEQDIAKVLAKHRPSVQHHSELQFQHYARKYWSRHYFGTRNLNPIAINIMIKLLKSEKLSLQNEPTVENRSILDTETTQESVLLCWAIERGHDLLIKFLLQDTNIDLNSGHKFGVHPLQLAIQMNQQETVSLILKASTTTHGWLHFPQGCPLEFALKQNSYDIASILMESGHVDPNKFTAGDPRATHLTQAVCMNNQDDVKFLLQYPQVDKNKLDGYGLSALHHAIAKEHKFMFELLLTSSSVDVNVVDHSGTPPLSMLIRKGKISLWPSKIPPAVLDDQISMLLSREQLDPNIQNEHGYTALHEACIYHYQAALRFLVSDPRVDLNARTKAGKTPLHIAVGNANRDVVKILLAKTSDLSVLRKQKPVDPNLANNDGDTPLHLAVQGPIGIVRELLESYGIQVKLKNKKGKRALDIARKKSHSEIAALLEEAEVDAKISSLLTEAGFL